MPQRSSQPDAYVRELVALGADPSHSVEELTALLRAHGMRGGDHVMRIGIKAFKQRDPALAKLDGEPISVTRAEAAQRLGVCIQRVDQMRRAGLLVSVRNEHTKEVRIQTASLRALVDQRRGTTVRQRRAAGVRRAWLRRRAQDGER